MAAPDVDTLDGWNISIIASPSKGDMVPIGADVVRWVPIDPTEVAEKNADPSVRGIGTDPFGFPWSGHRDEITADIAGWNAGGSHAGDEHVGEVLANSDPIL